MTAPSVSILVPTWNNADELVQCLESVRALEYPRERLEIVVFDNGSTDDTAPRVEARFARMRPEGWRRLLLARSPRNLGAFGGRAVALDSIDRAAEFVLSLDDDVIATPDSLRRLVDAAQGGAAAVGARIVYDDAPHEIASAAGYFNRWLGTYQERRPATRTPCDFVTSCGCLLRRASMDAVGGFDGAFFTSHGDVDLCLAFRDRGWTVLYEPAAVIRHKVARGGTRDPRRIYYVYRNKLLVLRKHLPAARRPLILALYALAWLPRAVVDSLAHHRGWRGPELGAIARGIRDGLLDRRGEEPTRQRSR
jgi:GT2 family glycosyltransferase